MSLPADDPRHGTNNGYVNLRCRCEPCREAGRIYQEKRRRQAGVPTREEFYESTRRHGWSRYKRGGCRCDICRAAAAAQKRRQRARNIEKYRQVWREAKARARQKS